MSTLKECVESGRRWRLGPNMSNGKTSPWLGPGIANNFDADLRILVSDAVASDFEIEPEPEKPREWTLHVPLPGSKYEFVESEYSAGRTKAPGHIAPESGRCVYGFPQLDAIRVHDADQCDRLHQNEVCGERMDGYICTLLKNHSGQHEARGGEMNDPCYRAWS